MTNSLSVRQQSFLDFATRYKFTSVMEVKQEITKKLLGLIPYIKTETVLEKMEFNDFTFKQTKGNNFEWESGNKTRRTEDEKCIKDRLEVLTMEYNLKYSFEVQVVNNYIIFVE